VTLADNDNFRWFEAGDELEDGTTILEVDRNNNQMIVYTNEAPEVGSTYISMSWSGAGKVSSVDISSRTITLVETNSQWGIGQHVTGEARTAEASSAFLTFDMNGENLELTNSQPAPVLMANTVDPVIHFPELFLNGETPDFMLPAGTTIKTTVTAINSNGQSVVTSPSIEPFSPGSTREAAIKPEIGQIVWDEEGLEFAVRAGMADFRNAASHVNEKLDAVADRTCKGCITNKALLEAEEAIK